MELTVEPSFVDAFKTNPIPFLVMALLAVVGVVLAIVALASSRNATLALVLGIAAAGLGLLVVGVGGLAWMRGRAIVDEVLQMPGLSAADQARLGEVGYAEAAMALWFGAFAAAAPLLVGGAATVVALARREPAAR